MRLSAGLRKWLGAAGLGFLLLYALPLFFPPPARSFVPTTVDAGLDASLFPHVPAWWVWSRLAALLIGAALVAVATPRPVVHLGALSLAPDLHRWSPSWIPQAAFAAAILHFAALAARAALPGVGQTLFMLWFAVPAALLAWGRTSRRLVSPAAPRRARTGVWIVAAVIAVWAVCRLIVSWHSPRAADVIDMWRIFGGIVHLTESKGNFLTELMDKELPGENAMQLFFQGLPLLQLTSHIPGLTWMQAVNVLWLGVCGAIVAALAANLVGRSTAAVAAATFLFSPFILLVQLSPVPSIAIVLPAISALLLIAFLRRGSPAALVLFGVAAGLSASLPPLVPATGVMLVMAAWRLWKSPGMPRIVVITAFLSFVTGFFAGAPAAGGGRMSRDYVLLNIPLSVAERALQGQLAPTIADWWLGNPPAGQEALILHTRRPIEKMLFMATGAILSPFATPRWPLRLWGDTMIDPLSAALIAVAIAVCARHAVFDPASLLLLVLLGTALLPGFTSSYDLPSLFRVLAAPILLPVLAAAGFRSLWGSLAGAPIRPAAAAVTALLIGAGGVLLFDVVNLRILPNSALGLLVKSVDEREIDRVALLTAEGKDKRPNMEFNYQYWELDWLRVHHPYMTEILRTVPKRPIAIVDVDAMRTADDAQTHPDVVFWTPALEQTTGVTEALCRRWPDAALYTITDAIGFTRLHGAQLGGAPWQPAVPPPQWTRGSCGERR